MGVYRVLGSMNKAYLIAALSFCVLACACDVMPPPATPEITPESTQEIAQRRFVEVDLNGVTVGVWIPAGWIADVQDGLIMSEHMPRLDDDTYPMRGMMVYFFVPELDRFTIPPEMTTDHNMAQIILEQVLQTPDLIGDAAMSDPTAFVWGAHKSAYYLLTGTDHTYTMVLAIALPDQQHLLVCNISAPPDYRTREGGLRATIPAILDGLTVDGIELEGADLNDLLNPLNFPPVPAAS